MSYVVNLNVEGKRCLIIGGGRVGARKARGLAEAGAVVTVLSSSFYEQLADVTYITAHYDRTYLEDVRPWLVITCTDSHETNAQAQADADTMGAIVMRADDSKAGDAYGMMKRERGPITITAGSGVPTFSRYLLDQFDAMLTPEVVQLAEELGAIREELKQRLPTADERTAIWKQITPRYDKWLAALRAGEAIDLHGEIEKLLTNENNIK